jgi:tetratricopeptide (TPR) repeat protein
MPATKVLADRPTFVWSPDKEKATAYHVNVVLAGSGRRVWTTTVKEPKLTYPRGEPALRRGRKYEWSVVAEVNSKTTVLCKSSFSVASAEDVEKLKGIAKWAASKSQGDLLLAALAYESIGMYEEALALFERLSQRSPEVGAFHAILAKYYFEPGGRAEEARKAWAQAKKLHYPVPEEY